MYVILLWPGALPRGAIPPPPPPIIFLSLLVSSELMYIDVHWWLIISLTHYDNFATIFFQVVEKKCVTVPFLPPPPLFFACQLRGQSYGYGDNTPTPLWSFFNNKHSGQGKRCPPPPPPPRAWAHFFMWDGYPIAVCCKLWGTTG